MICTHICPLYVHSSFHYMCTHLSIICTHICPLYVHTSVHHVYTHLSMICTHICPLYVHTYVHHMYTHLSIISSLGLLPLASPSRMSTDRLILVDLPAVVDSPSSPLTTLWSDHIRCKIQLHRQRLSNGSCSMLGSGTRSLSSRTSIEGQRRRKQPSSTSSPTFCPPSICKLQTAF